MRRAALHLVSLAAVLAATTSAHAVAAPEAAEVELEVLWSQVNEDSGVGLTSQNFESSFDAFDDQGADDFVVPEGEAWVIRRIEARGTHFGGTGPLDSMGVVFYRSSDKHLSKPGRVVHEFPQLAAQSIHLGTDYLISLPKPVKLKPGHYWISLQGNMSFVESGQWGWETTRSLTGWHAVWKNPGDGFETGCTHYRRLLKCFGALGQGPDFMFVLYGKR
jgi:hypothetical protein